MRPRLDVKVKHSCVSENTAATAARGAPRMSPSEAM